MNIEDIVTMRRLVVGTVTTTIGAATSAASDLSVASNVEPAWLNIAIKYGTLAAAFVTVVAGLLKMWLDWRKDRREERAARRRY